MVDWSKQAGEQEPEEEFLDERYIDDVMSDE